MKPLYAMAPTLPSPNRSKVASPVSLTCISSRRLPANACITAASRAQIAIPILDFLIPGASTADEAIRQGVELFNDLQAPRAHQSHLRPLRALVPPGDENLEKIRVIAEELDASIHMHVHETAFEVQQSVEQRGERPLARLAPGPVGATFSRRFT